MSCRAAGVLSHRGLQGIPQRGAARRTCASFPETHIFFRDRFRSPYTNQVVAVRGVRAKWRGLWRRCRVFEKLCRIFACPETKRKEVFRMGEACCLSAQESNRLPHHVLTAQRTPPHHPATNSAISSRSPIM